MTDTNTKETEVRKRGMITAYFRAWKNIFTYDKRTTRYEFFSFLFLNILVGIIFSPIYTTCPFEGLKLLIQWAFILVYIGACVRRFHDIGWSGYYIGFTYFYAVLGPLFVGILKLNNLLSGIMIYAVGIFFLIMFILMFLKGSPDKNDYGLPISWKE